MWCVNTPEHKVYSRGSTNSVRLGQRPASASVTLPPAAEAVAVEPSLGTLEVNGGSYFGESVRRGQCVTSEKPPAGKPIDAM